MARTIEGNKVGTAGYLGMLKGLVAWGKVEGTDSKLEAIMRNIQHGAKKAK